MRFSADDFRTSLNSDSPDLDWSQVRETVFILNLAVGQIFASLKDGDESIGTLSGDFIRIVGDLTEIESLANRISFETDENISENDKDINTDSKQLITEKCKSISQGVQKSIVTFQFYDRLCQRLERVSDGLADVANLIGDSDKLYSPFEWNKLHHKIHTSYGTEEERKMLTLLKDGYSVAKAIEEVVNKTNTPIDDPVELF